MSSRSGRIAVLGAAGACLACCAAPIGAGAVALLGSAVTAVYPAAGLVILAVAAILAWRFYRKRRRARSQANPVDLPSVITVGPPGHPSGREPVLVQTDTGQRPQPSVSTETGGQR